MTDKNPLRRDFLKFAGSGIAGTAAGLIATPHAYSQSAPAAGNNGAFNVRTYGATGDGVTLDSPAINNAIIAAAANGGGTVHFPAGTYLCYSIRLKSKVALFLEPGSTILAASVPVEGRTTGAYDLAESNAPWESFQDYGHNHWHNSLFWARGCKISQFSGSGLICGKGLSAERNSSPARKRREWATKRLG